MNSPTALAQQLWNHRGSLRDFQRRFAAIRAQAEAGETLVSRQRHITRQQGRIMITRDRITVDAYAHE